MRGEVGKKTPKNEMENPSSKVVQIGLRLICVLGCRKILLLSETVLNYGPFHIFTIGYNKEHFDLIRAFDYNPSPNFLELRQKMPSLLWF